MKQFTVAKGMMPTSGFGLWSPKPGTINLLADEQTEEIPVNKDGLIQIQNCTLPFFVMAKEFTDSHVLKPDRDVCSIVSFCGWHQGKWYDGPLGIGESFTWQPGPTMLSGPLSTCATDSHVSQSGVLASVVAAVRLKSSPGLEIKTFNRDNAVLLTLFRMAFGPSCRIHLAKPIPPPWRTLLDHLQLNSCDEELPSCDGDVLLLLKSLGYDRLDREINLKTEIIPKRL